MDLEQIILKSAFIEERRRGGAYGANASDRSGGRLAAWRGLLNVPEDDTLFGKRLRAGRITEEEALDICGDCVAAGIQEIPAWAEVISEVTERLPFTAEAAETCTALRRAELPLTGPVRSLFPFVQYCENVWKEQEQLPLGDLSRMVLNRLYQAAYQTFNTKARFMMLMGHKTEGLWDTMETELLSGGWEKLFEEYPVLARRMGTVIVQTLGFIEEFRLRFREKKAVLEREFFGGVPIGRIVKLDGEISDLHRDGRCVLLLTLDGDRKLVYKPRSLEIDVRWETFVENFADAKDRIKAPHAVDFKEFGFVEHICHRPCESLEEVKTYFYNAGALMALLYAFGGNDFHRENIISAGTRPVMIDTETLMIPVARPFEHGGRDKPEEEGPRKRTLAEMIENSVLNIGMLPLVKTDENHSRDDVGALTGDSAEWNNLPVFQGRRHSAVQYPEQVAGGFLWMYRRILDNRRELLEGRYGIRMFQGCRFRMLIRTSQVYANVIKYIGRSAVLKDGFDYSLQTERMAKAFLYTAADEILPELIRVFLSEKKALEKGCIPIFYGESGGEGILDDEELLFANYFSKNPMEHAAECIGRMDEEDLALQLQIIKKSLAAELGDAHGRRQETGGTKARPAGKPAAGGAETIRDTDLLEEAETICREIMDDRILAQNGDYSWLTDQYDINSGGSRLNLMNSSLYDGLLGIGVFAAALYRSTGRREYKKTADYCIDKTARALDELMPSMERYQVPLGYGGGVGGLIAGLETAAEYTGNGNGAEAAERLISGITEKHVSGDSRLDVLGGASGLVLALTRGKAGNAGRPRESGTERLLEWCGKRLLAGRKEQTAEGYLVWASPYASQPLTGLGHGMAGIALALMRIYQVLGGSEYLAAAREAMEYENAVFDGEACNWPDFRSRQEKKPPDSMEAKEAGAPINGIGDGKRIFMSGYCSGAPGIGLARLAVLPAAAEAPGLAEILLRDIGRADRFIKEFSRESRDHLCCGRTAGIDFLIEKALALDDREALELARTGMAGLLREKTLRGQYCLMSSDGRLLKSPALFQGTAGIAYEMLRLSAPETIRSVLI